MAIPNLWRTKKQRYTLQGELCVHCAQAVFPPREVCPHCHAPMLSKTQATPPKELHFVFAAAPAQPPLAAVVGDD